MEKWKDIEGYDDYQISNFGRVKTFKKYHKSNFGKILTYSLNKGYYFVKLYKNKKPKSFTVHSLVWDHFGVGERNGMILQVDHKDENKLNNRIDNLQLLTGKENINKHWNNVMINTPGIKVTIIF